MAVLTKDSSTGLFLPEGLTESHTSLKDVLNKLLEDCVNQLSHLKDNYFLTIHAKFDNAYDGAFTISQPIASLKLPGFVSNSMVFWVSNKRGLCELLWSVAPKLEGEKPKVEFNKKGVAYLRAKGAMPS